MKAVRFYDGDGLLGLAIPPGATIEEMITERCISTDEFAIKMNMSEDQIHDLLNGRTKVDYDIATALSSVLGLPAHFWTALERFYREDLARFQTDDLS